ncbi:methyl-accepting chemotaxis protein [Aurantimonas sp. E1-2-R+4]|uniref:methyl-accepting chemotaxis protein n=2 Tax=unclassified Aurantimonas TaxID=2638230 RepID=UPI002F930D73
MGVFQEQFSILESAMAHVAEVIESEAVAASQRATASAAIGRNLMGTAVGIGTLFALGLTFFARRSVVTPIQELASDMQQLVEGRTDVSLKGANRKDELGEIGRGVLAFQEVVTARARRDADEAEERRRQEMDSAERETATRLEQSKAQSFVVENLSHGLENLSQGDLTVRLDRSFAPEFEPIRIKFNDSVGKLEGAIGNVVTSIGSIRSGLSEINTASNDLAQRTEQQAANLEETVAALGEVTTAVNETADGAGKAQTAASTARGKAQKGGEIVGQAVAAMSQIEKSSEQINQIIGVIDEIAFQTNLLALNAGVEAARAGEAGKGFAVVAQEVRGLAQRSAEAAKEIKTLIATSRSQVESGVELVTASGKSLDEIVAEVSSMAELIATIAVSAKEQATSLREVSGAADQMDKVTQQNAAMVEEATAASQTLTNETEELASAMAQFKTGSAGQTSRSRSNPAQSGRSATPSRGVPQMKTTGTGGAARAPKAESDSWEEF